jgi:hypothetical protein
VSAAAVTSIFASQGTQARPLRAWTDAALVELASRVDQIVQAWAEEWGVRSQPLARVHCQASSKEDELGGRWLPFRHAGGDAAWLQWGESSGAELAGALLGVPDCTTPVVAAVLAACREDAVQRLAAAFGVSLQSANVACGPPAQASPWSGRVSLSLPWGGRLLLEAGVVKPLVPPARPLRPQSLAPALVRITQALANYPTRLQARLEPCDIALAELQDLRPGDVLRLTHRVTAPVTLGDPAGADLFDGWLARRAGLKAVELVARDAH